MGAADVLAGVSDAGPPHGHVYGPCEYDWFMAPCYTRADWLIIAGFVFSLLKRSLSCVSYNFLSFKIGVITFSKVNLSPIPKHIRLFLYKTELKIYLLLYVLFAFKEFTTV